MLRKVTDNLHALPTINSAASRSKTAKTYLVVGSLAIAGWIGSNFPATGAEIVTDSLRNGYRACTGRMLNSGVSPEAAARACAGALYPKDIARCVSRIEGQTEISAQDALATCTQARRPVELSRCVVGISENTEGQPVPGVLDFCGRSLLPIRYAECVVGLRREINDLAPTQAMETCISASDRPLEFAPNFIPQGQLQQPVQSPALTEPAIPEPTPTTPETAPAPDTPPPATP
jgi:hypothetical protein